MRRKVVWIHIDHLANPGKDVWGIQYGRDKYYTAKEADIRIPLKTVFRGIKARQPKAYLRGKGVVTIAGGKVTITED